MDAPLFSVIIPFRNAGQTLPQTLASLRAQSFGDWEAILVNDASSDDGMAVAQGQARAEPRLRIVDEGLDRPRGAAATRNLGIRLSRGRIVAFLDADDLWRPDKLERQARAFAEGAPIVFSSYQRIDASGQPLGVVAAPPRVGWADALAGNPIGCLTAAFDTARFGRAEMPLLPMHEDYAFWLGLLRGGAVAQGLPEVLADYRVSPGSASSNKARAAAAVWRILGDEGLGPVRRSVSFARYALTGLRRRL
ncbi:glycosyltransferase family 2 protein [Rubellimicrobium arenae]|uniref:glycosyltransferase family 2 protein n=1 Tax=Rubellimicrobium arenae TaxID=2817372 RepID=UPI001B303AB0|nr:glycosyltransferase family A protein [Rubellimicrobium arenae]